MSKIEISTKQREVMITQLQQYFIEELDQELGHFDGEFLLDFFSKNIGAFYYNQGLHDALSVFSSKMESIDDEIYSIEKETF